MQQPPPPPSLPPLSLRNLRIRTCATKGNAKPSVACHLVGHGLREKLVQSRDAFNLNPGNVGEEKQIL
jgi:hypothetical protein